MPSDSQASYAIDQETVNKLTGDFKEDAQQALYLLAADRLSNSLRGKIIQHLNSQKDKEPNTILSSEIGHEISHLLLSEFAFNYSLAALIELLPVEGLQDHQKYLACSLRILAIKGVGESLLEMTGILRREMESAILEAHELVSPRYPSPLSKSPKAKQAAAEQAGT